MPNLTKCGLHVPHKDWNSDLERENYLSIERWASNYLRRYVSLRSTRSTPLNIPHKDYSGSQLELENYETIENWVYQKVPASLGQTKVGFTRWDLHIPNKNWALDQPNGIEERENYLAIERWAERFIRVCLLIGSVA